MEGMSSLKKKVCIALTICMLITCIAVPGIGSEGTETPDVEETVIIEDGNAEVPGAPAEEPEFMDVRLADGTILHSTYYEDMMTWLLPHIPYTAESFEIYAPEYDMFGSMLQSPDNSNFEVSADEAADALVQVAVAGEETGMEPCGDNAAAHRHPGRQRIHGNQDLALVVRARSDGPLPGDAVADENGGDAERRLQQLGLRT